MINSLDFLYIVIAFAVLICTGFLVWILYYFAMILKQGNQMMTDIRKRLEEIEEALMNMKNKMTSSLQSFTFFTREIASFSKFIADIRQKKTKNRSTKGKKPSPESDSEETE